MVKFLCRRDSVSVWMVTMISILNGIVEPTLGVEQMAVVPYALM